MAPVAPGYGGGAILPQKSTSSSQNAVHGALPQLPPSGPALRQLVAGSAAARVA